MAETRFHLAQFNVARLATSLDAPEMTEFIAFLAPVNAFAEQSPGFVWRLTAPDGASSTYMGAGYDDPMVVPNLSVWTDLESLRVFVYQTVHRYFLQNRRAWFARMEGPVVVLWWTPAGMMPTLAEARAKLGLLSEQGSTRDAFTFHEAFDSDGAPLPRPDRAVAD